MLKKLAKTIVAITMVITLSLTVTPIYNIDAKDNNSEAKQYIETSYKTSYRPSYSGDAAWLNDFELEEDPATAGEVILVKYVGDAEDLYIPATVEIDSTQYAVRLTNKPYNFFISYGNYYNNTTTKSITFDPNINTSNVTDMSRMFYNCTALTTLDVSNFNTENVTNMNGMFDECKSLTTLDVSNFNTANVTDMNRMFHNCASLTTLDVSNFITENVTDMSYMFSRCSALTTLDVSNFNTEIVTNMQGMFSGCIAFTTLDVSNFITENVTNMNGMFDECKSLTTLDVSNFNTANVTDMNLMFGDCESLTTLDVSNLNTDNVTRMWGMFGHCESLTTLDLSNFNTENVTDIRNMFSHCYALTTLDLSNFNTEHVALMDDMFSYCSSLTNLNISSFDLANLTETPIVLDRCNSLQTIKTPTNLLKNVKLPGTFYRLDNPSETYTYLPKNQTTSFTIVNGDHVVPTSVSVSPTSKSIGIGESFTIVPTVLPANATNKSVTWTSSAPTIASVDTTGKVTGLASGTATITAVTNAGGLATTCSVTVNSDVVNVTGITVTPTSKTMNAGENYLLTPIITPENATDQSITWSSSDNAIATVDANGIVTALTAGTATITAKTNDGDFTSTCVITVIGDTVDVTGITVTPTTKALTVGEDFTITPTVTPDNATDKSVTWTTSDDTIATVDANGKVTALKEGTATITATTNDGGFTASCIITVIKSEGRVTGITLTPISKTAHTGEVFFITPTITPVDAVDKSVTWSSSNPSIATVDSNGKVTAIKEGVVTITATTNDGGLKATCTVTVVDSTVDVHRFYNPISGEHLFTSNDSERSYLTAIGWNYEGVAWNAPYSSNRPVYRVFNPYTGEHHYTMNDDERNYLLLTGWNNEGISWYSVNTNTRGTPVYRLFNPYIKGIGAHHYTVNTSERDYLITIGWNYEGIGWYGL